MAIARHTTNKPYQDATQNATRDVIKVATLNATWAAINNATSKLALLATIQATEDEIWKETGGIAAKKASFLRGW